MTTRRAFGEELRLARERRGISLSAIADATKISRSLFDGLERGDCSRWPGGIYNRAYVRDYARAIGLPPDDVLERFQACYGEEPGLAGKPEQRTGPGPVRSAPPLRLTLSIDPAEHRNTMLLRARFVAIDALMVAGVGAAVASLTGTDFWMSAALASLGCHALGVFGTGRAVASTAAAALRRAGTAPIEHDEPRDEPVAAGPLVSFRQGDPGLHGRVM